MKLKPIPSVRRAARDAQRVDAPAADGTITSDVRGLIDNATSDRLFGWAWDAAHPGRRLRVELRLAGEVVANTIADFVRPDLAKNGVGDGCHAFEFPLLPDWVERRAELTAVAFGIDGSEVPIAMRIRRPDDGVIQTQLQRAVEAMLGEHQQMRADVAALQARAAQLPDADAVAAIAAGQEELQRKVQALELWLARLDGSIGIAGQGAGGRGRGGIDLWEVVLVATLAAASAAALAAAATRFISA